MHKKTLAGIAVIVILVLAVFNIAGAGETSAEQAAGESQAEAVGVGLAEAAGEEQVDYAPQLQLLAANSFQFLMGFGSPDYAVTDLDHNGRLEVFATDNGGDVGYTAFMLYEVNEALDGLDLIFDNTMYDESKLNPDVSLYEVMETYCVDDTYYYVVYDRIIDMGVTTRKDLEILSLKDGELTIEMKGSSGCADNGAFEYYDAEGNVTDWTAFDSVAAEMFPDAVPQQTTVKWIPEDEIRKGDPLAALTGSWEVFALTELEEEHVSWLEGEEHVS